MSRAVSKMPAEAFAQFSQRLASDGLRDALAYLLHLTDYRFVGIFRFRADRATAALHIDRENPAEQRSAEVPEETTYCCYVRDDKAAFVTANAPEDPRLATHAARMAVPAYVGVPVMDPEGHVLGVLCFYDVVARDPAQVDLDLLLQVASALAYGGHVPPYPEPVAA